MTLATKSEKKSQAVKKKSMHTRIPAVNVPMDLTARTCIASKALRLKEMEMM